jgi:hypothetical protein
MPAGSETTGQNERCSDHLDKPQLRLTFAQRVSAGDSDELGPSEFTADRPLRE